MVHKRISINFQDNDIRRHMLDHWKVKISELREIRTAYAVQGNWCCAEKMETDISMTIEIETSACKHLTKEWRNRGTWGSWDAMKGNRN